jgi:ceramide glucosyltransferase
MAVHWCALLALGAAVCANIYYWLTAVSAWSFRRRPLPRREGPPASILIPLKGADASLEENLAAFCRLDYPEYQLVFALETASDPAFAVVERIARRFPNRDIEAVVSEARIGANPKENNHANAYSRAKHPWLVLADGDVAARPDYLKTVLAPLHDGEVGLVTCPYRFVGLRGLWSRLRAMTIHAGFIPSVLVAWRLAPVRFGLGATLAFRRETLAEIGGFPAVADFIASDYWLANKAADAGYRVELIPYWLDIRLEPQDFLAYWRYQLRWVRTMLWTTPAGYAGTIVTHGFFWSLCFLALTGGSRAGWLLVAATMTSRVITGILVWRLYLGSREIIGHILLLPLADALGTVFWALGFLGREVHWAGRVFTLGPGTRIRTR